MDRMIKDASTGRFVRHKTPNICSMSECGVKAHGLGFCSRHYNRVRRWGDPLAMKKRADGTGTFHNGYLMIRVGGDPIFQHRHIMEKHLGRKLLRSEIVHHKNGDRLDNRVSNLQVMLRSKHPLHHQHVLHNLKLGPQNPRKRA